MVSGCTRTTGCSSTNVGWARPSSSTSVLEVDLAAAGISDDLADTIDYGAVAATVHDRLTGPAHDLVEAVAADVAAAVLAHDQRIDAVEVTVHKPQAPVGVDLQDVAVTIRAGAEPGMTRAVTGVPRARDQRRATAWRR